MLSSSSNASSQSELFECDLNTNYCILGCGSYSVVIKPYITKVDTILYDNLDIHGGCKHNYVAKIYTEENKKEFDKELSILQKITTIDNYTNFTVPIAGASSFDVIELENEIDILQKLKKDTKRNFVPKEQLYQIVLGYGGVSICSIYKEYSYITLSFTTFMSMILEFYSGLQKLQDIGIIHRDIKPVNVLYDQVRLYIIDFSISCSVSQLYTNDPDQMYILSYMYMYNAPEFYIAYLMLKNEQSGMDFQTNLKQTFNTMGQYSKELEIFYYEHYYRYNKNEPYNIFSYQQGFSKFYDTILSKEIDSIQEIFTDDLAFKSDIYSSYFILKQLKKYIIFENALQKHIFNTLCDMTSALNPYERSSVSQILNYINDNMFC